MPRRYYHASPRRLPVGTILTGGRTAEGTPTDDGIGHTQVCLTTSPVPHVTIFDLAIREGWLVYEVEPIGRDRRHKAGNGNGEIVAPAARVLRLVGTARGIARGRKVGSAVPRRASVEDSLGWRLG